ncbi:hypothetical protein NYG88_08705 [Campylobacter felis]|uniref:hypothetical protein n=1 Tax=Campylobacter felis TaxID=2974565 RepID=UPI00256AC0FA|nr:hypothetical protein [Campylobacter felis]
MDNAKEALKELFGISEVQAVVIEKLYFKAKTPKDILVLLCLDIMMVALFMMS